MANKQQKSTFFYTGDNDVNVPVALNAVSLTNVPKVNGARPVGASILVEMLTPQEAVGSQIILNDNPDSAIGANQGYVLATGPGLGEHHGIKVGDRVLLQGTCVPLPKYDEGRRKVIVQFHDVKAILEENK